MMRIESKDKLSHLMRYYLDLFINNIKLPILYDKQKKIDEEKKWMKSKINYYKKKGYQDSDIKIIKLIDIDTLRKDRMWFYYKIYIETPHSKFTLKSEETYIKFITNKQTKYLNDIGIDIEKQYDTDNVKIMVFSKKIKRIICKSINSWCQK